MRKPKQRNKDEEPELAPGLAVWYENGEDPPWWDNNEDYSIEEREVQHDEATTGRRRDRAHERV